MKILNHMVNHNILNFLSNSNNHVNVNTLWFRYIHQTSTKEKWEWLCVNIWIWLSSPTVPQYQDDTSNQPHIMDSVCFVQYQINCTGVIGSCGTQINQTRPIPKQLIWTLHYLHLISRINIFTGKIIFFFSFPGVAIKL